jgi:hypothetical protein
MRIEETNQILKDSKLRINEAERQKRHTWQGRLREFSSRIPRLMADPRVRAGLAAAAGVVAAAGVSLLSARPKKRAWWQFS